MGGRGSVHLQILESASGTERGETGGAIYSRSFGDYADCDRYCAHSSDLRQTLQRGRDDVSLEDCSK